MIIPDAKAAVNKGWDTLKKSARLDFKKVKPKLEIIQQRVLCGSGKQVSETRGEK